MNVGSGQLHLMSLIARDADRSGWASASAAVWTVVKNIPTELVELLPSDDGGGKVRLTEEGRVVLKWQG